jgi:hypothetical protein
MFKFPFYDGNRVRQSLNNETGNFENEWIIFEIDKPIDSIEKFNVLLVKFEFLTNKEHCNNLQLIKEQVEYIIDIINKNKIVSTFLHSLTLKQSEYSRLEHVFHSIPLEYKDRYIETHKNIKTELIKLAKLSGKFIMNNKENVIDNLNSRYTEIVKLQKIKKQEQNKIQYLKRKSLVTEICEENNIVNITNKMTDEEAKEKQKQRSKEQYLKLKELKNIPNKSDVLSNEQKILNKKLSQQKWKQKQKEKKVIE